MTQRRAVVAAGDLAADPDNLAPVSGARCRSCGASARLADPKDLWPVIHGAAYCPPCDPDRQRDEE